MKTKNFNKKIIAFFLLSLFFVFCSFGLARAYTESDCKDKGGACQNASCGNSSNTIGSCWESGNASFNRDNCCGNASNAQKTIYSSSGSSGGGITLPTGTGLSSSTIAAILAGLLKWLLAIFGFLAIMSFIISGIMYLTSMGDSDRQETAKNQMIWSIVGVIVGLSGYVAIQAITSWMSGGSAF